MKSQFAKTFLSAAVLSLAVLPDRASVAVPLVESLVISEVFYDAPGADDGLEWVELFNGTRSTIELSGWLLGFGGADYTTGRMRLSGLIGPGAYFVAGGPHAVAANSAPRFDLLIDIEPDLQNSGATADGIGLFQLDPADITDSSLPHDTVVYGSTNTNGLLDPFGNTNVVHIADAPPGVSLERISATLWRHAVEPTPGSGPLDSQTLPEPGTAVLLLTTLGLLCATSIRVRA